MRQIYSIIVENKSGALARISGLFARRGFNIESLVVGETEDPTISRMTIVSNGDSSILEQVEKQLNKQIDIIKVTCLKEDSKVTVRRELALIKVSSSHGNRGDISDICNIMGAKIVDMSRTTITLEFTGKPEKIDMLLNLLSPFGIVEMAKTGMVALQKGSGDIHQK